VVKAARWQSRLGNALNLRSRARQEAVFSGFYHGLLRGAAVSIRDRGLQVALASSVHNLDS